MMEYKAFDFEFQSQADPTSITESFTIFNIRLQLGEVPIVRNLRKLFRLKQADMPADLRVLYDKSDLYTVTHAIGTISQGARIEELLYEAEIIDQPQAQTIALIPNTQIQSKLSGSLGMDVALSAAGNISAEVPEEVSALAQLTEVDIGGGIKLKTGINGGVKGKFSFSFNFPVVQAMGVASSKCTWLLKPDGSKLLNGDQLMMQTIAVPKGTSTLTYRIASEITADKGWFWKKKKQKTEPIEIAVPLT